jgi:hydroxyacylglutathione hydrolase
MQTGRIGAGANQPDHWLNRLIERDRALVLGDVLNNQDLRTGLPGLHEPPAAFTPDPARNRASVRRLAELEPALMCFGHGPPLRETRRFVGFVDGLAR